MVVPTTTVEDFQDTGNGRVAYPVKESPPLKKINKNNPKRNPKKGKQAIKEPDVEQLTPYQGPNKTCGLFHCDNCNKEWFSANSWANCFQKCNGCNGPVYPHRQFPPEPGHGREEDRPPHPQDMCQKCMKLGHPCVRYRSIETEYRPRQQNVGRDNAFSKSVDSMAIQFENMNV